MVRLSYIFPIALLVALGLTATSVLDPLNHDSFDYPQGWTEPTYNFENNPISNEKVALGRKLFYEPRLSEDNTISCASCHLSYTAFTHVDHALSHGIRDSIGTRNSPALVNLAWGKQFMWDGAVNHLDVQALAPITHPAEMGEDLNNVIKKLQASEEYPPLFQSAFGDPVITGEHLLKALASFQVTLISANSKYDKMVRREAEFSEQEINGYELFKANCSSCHPEPLFTTGEFANNGLPVDSTLNDWGRMLITKQSEDSLKFKIPSLRNVEFSFPYMHDGRFRSLSQVMSHYEKGVQLSPTLAPELRKDGPKAGISLSSTEKTDLVAFLLTLTDKEFLFNPDHAFPRP